MSRNALKLGGKSKDVDSFVDQLKSEGEKISNLTPAVAGGGSGAAAKAKISADIHTERLGKARCSSHFRMYITFPLELQCTSQNGRPFGCAPGTRWRRAAV